jgi:hypothetical protein
LAVDPFVLRPVLRYRRISKHPRRCSPPSTSSGQASIPLKKQLFQVGEFDELDNTGKPGGWPAERLNGARVTEAPPPFKGEVGRGMGPFRDFASAFTPSPPQPSP